MSVKLNNTWLAIATYAGVDLGGQTPFKIFLPVHVLATVTLNSMEVSYNDVFSISCITIAIGS